MPSVVVTYRVLLLLQLLVCDTVGQKGLLGRPCLPQSPHCMDANAECRSNVCLCQPTFYEKRAICRTSATLWTVPTAYINDNTDCYTVSLLEQQNLDRTKQ